MRTTTLVIVASVTLCLAACGDASDSADSSQATTAASAEAGSSESSDTTASDDAAEASTQEASEDAQTEAAEETRDTMESEKSARGNLIKEVGETATVATEGGEGDVLVEFAITDIETDAECTNEYAEEPLNGNYIVLTVEVTTMPELAEQEFVTSWGFNPYDFQIFSADGKRENDSTGNAYSCLSDSDALPYDIGAGQTVEGKIALDSAYQEGVVAYVPSLVGAGWEWEFGSN